MHTKYQDWALFAVRVVVAAIFIYAAYAKLPLWSGAPEGMTPLMVALLRLLSIVEPLGALAVLLGFLTRPAASGLAVIMVGAIFVMQFMMGVGFATSAGTGWNFPLMVLAGCLMLMAFGAGRFSLDALRSRSRA